MVLNCITIHDIASYREPVNFHFKKINYFFGSNGSGKTTLSNILGGYIVQDGNEVKSKEEILVYNKKFVESNFDLELKGIFTLGEKSVAKISEVKNLKQEKQEKQDLIEKKEASVSKLKEDIDAGRSSLKEESWKLQQELGTAFPLALIGYRKSKEKFLSKLLEEQTKVVETDILDFNTLEERYTPAFSTEIKSFEKLKTIKLELVSQKESSNILKKKIIGSVDSPIGTFVEYLKNSDWMRSGIDFLEKSDSKCPFCQQKLPSNFEVELSAYFDTTFQNDLNELNEFVTDYDTFIDDLIEDVKDLSDSEIKFIDFESLVQDINRLETTKKLNFSRLEKKQESPSVQIELESVMDICRDINSKINTFNKQIDENNNVCDNQKLAQENFRAQLWKHFVKEAKNAISIFNNLKNSRAKGINGIENTVKLLKDEISKIDKKVTELEQDMSTIQPTIIAINSILEKFGFRGFKLGENEVLPGTYKIIREDGSDAKKTLSEGEYNFITFLYYYYLIYGSHNSSGIQENKVIVIDDPISSLDSNVIFIVSSLVKRLIEDCRKNENGIMQVIILTHNMYFHKEVSFLGSRDKFKKDEAMFGLIRKNEGITYLNEFSENPIQSTYEMLWKDIKDASCSSATCFNNMRRILEHYFQVIGGINYEDCINKFEGEDKLTCQSLISVINDGSHFINDDFVVQFDPDNIQSYKNVFKQVFTKLNQENHYEMMMSR